MRVHNWLLPLVLLAALVTMCLQLLPFAPYFNFPYTSTTSLRGSTSGLVDAYTAKASSYDEFRASSPGWDDAVRKHISHKPPLSFSILDLGCGSGAFLPKLLASQPFHLECIDRNQAMINIALTRASELSKLSPFTTVNIRVGDVVELQDDTFDIVFCAQVLQNLTPNPFKAAEARVSFMKQMYRILKPGGKAIIMTRAVKSGLNGRYSDLYWYADPLVVPAAVEKMELMVPRDPISELSQAGFISSELLSSGDTVIRRDAYLSPVNLKNAAFRSADSFFQHVSTPEMKSLFMHIDELQGSGRLDEYVHTRDTLRGGEGHVVTLVGHKAESITKQSEGLK